MNAYKRGRSFNRRSSLMHYFSSTAIRAASYSAESGKLTLWFASGGEARDYHHVPEHVFTGLLNAPSKGRYFDEHIRDQFRP